MSKGLQVDIGELGQDIAKEVVLNQETLNLDSKIAQLLLHLDNERITGLQFVFLEANKILRKGDFHGK